MLLTQRRGRPVEPSAQPEPCLVYTLVAPTGRSCREGAVERASALGWQGK